MAETQVQQDAAGRLQTSRPAAAGRTSGRAFFSNRLAIFGTVIMSIFILMAVFAPLVAPYDPAGTRTSTTSSPGRAWRIPSGRTSLAATSSRA